jgi:hypothetical protein
MRLAELLKLSTARRLQEDELRNWAGAETLPKRGMHRVKIGNARSMLPTEKSLRCR